MTENPRLDARDRLSARPLTGTFGARVEGIDLAHPLARSELELLMEMLRQHKVLVFRDQRGVGPGELLAFSRNFGEPETEEHPTHPNLPDYPGVKVLESNINIRQNVGDTWHTDGATRERTRCITVLQAIDVPSYGRDTLFADMEAAYRGLSGPMQTFLDGMTALHSWGRQKPGAPPVEHPVIHVDPTSGLKSLYVNQLYTQSIVELTADESRALLAFLYMQTHIPEIQLRVSWDPGTIVMWDNERTQHYLVLDQEYRRIMHRCMMF